VKEGDAMIRYIAKRILISFLTIWVIATASFFLLRILPGNPFQSDVVMTTEMRDQLMAHYGLDRPLWEQYLKYMTNALKGDLGYSFKYTGRSVDSIIAKHFPVSASLGLRAIAIGFPTGIFLGTVAARKRGTPADYLCVFISIVGISIPSFILASLTQYLFGVKLGVLPIAGWKGYMYTILPTFAMSLGMIAGETRSMRASMLEVASQDYIKTAKAKGLSARQVVWRHQIRNALLPLLTGLGLRSASLLMGSLIIEQIFVIPGLGLYYTNAIRSLDYTMVMGLTIFYGSILVFTNFITDLSYGLVDPRVRVTD
jgi:oligopeptide transport system permease protein